MGGSRGEAPGSDQAANGAASNSPALGDWSTAAMPRTAAGQTSTVADAFAGRTLSHYRIEARLGAGGMGVVYRATDLTLGRTVAIKVLSRQLATSDDAKARFLREARAASALDHPNIGVIYELSEHDGELFIAMAFYDGESLKQRIQRGPLPLASVLDILRQIASGLEAAHRAGIVHRDIKPANILLTAGGTVKILDFGLAKLIFHSEAQSVTNAGEVLGTLLYMSPEQLKGQDVDHRTDLWSLGVVAYELVSGTCPFRSESNVSTSHQILNEEPRSLATTPGVPSWLAVLIEQLLRKNPADRPGTATEIIKCLDGQTQVPARRRTPWTQRLAAVAAVALLAALCATALVLMRSRITDRGAARSPAAAAKKRQAVAVLGLNDLSQRSESAWLATALTEMLISELGVGERLLVVSGESVAQMKRNLNLAAGLTYSSETLQRIRKLIDADFVVFGSYILLPDKKLRLDLRFQQATEGAAHSLSDTGSESDLFDLVSRVGNGLRRKLGVAEVTESDAQIVRSSLPSNPEAARLYSEGLAKLRGFDAVAARELLERAIGIDPDHALAHSALSRAWSLLGFDERAKLEAKKAFELSTNLSREDKLSVEGRFRAASRDFEKAIENYKALFSFFPENLEYGLRLAEVQDSAGHAQDSLATLESLRRLPLPASGDPRIDLQEADAAKTREDFKRQLSVATRALARAVELKAPLLEARALGEKGFALDHLGQRKEALAAYKQSKELATSLGDKQVAALIGERIGWALYGQGDLPAARKMFEESLAVRNETGNRRGIASSLNGLSNVLLNEGNLEAAKQGFEESLGIWREIGNKSGTIAALGNLGLVLREKGELARAKQRAEEALVIAREIGAKLYQASILGDLAALLVRDNRVSEGKKKYQEALALGKETGDKGFFAIGGLVGLAEAEAAAGDLPGARHSCTEALEFAKETGSKSGRASALFQLGAILQKAGNLPEARKNYEEALSLSTETGEKTDVAEERLALSKLLLDEGSPAEADDLARQAGDELGARGKADRRAEAESIRAKALVQRSRFEHARNAIARADELSAKSEDRRLKLAIAIADAEVDAGTRPGSAQKALHGLQEVIAQAAQGGSVDYELQARLTLGQIELKHGNAVRGRRQLEQLEQDSRAKGFSLIANKAASAVGKP